MVLLVSADFIGIIGDPGKIELASVAVDHLSETLLYAIGSCIVSTINGADAPGGENLVARRRYQQGCLRDVNGKWKFEWREDVVEADGIVARRLRKATLGAVSDMTQKMARREADRILADAGVNNLAYRPGRVSTLSEFADTWDRDVLVLHKGSTRPPDRSRLQTHIKPLLGSLRLDSINQATIQGFARRLFEKGLAPKSVKNVLVTLSAMCNTARDWGYMVGDFNLRRIVLPARALKQRGRKYSVDEARNILTMAAPPWNYLLLTAALTGLRRGELLGLRWCDIDFGAELIRVEQSVWAGQIQTTKTEDSDRVVPMPSALANALREYQSKWKPNDLDLLWAEENGSPVDGDNLQKRHIKPLLQAVGIKGRAGLHAFRHLVGTLMVSEGANPKVVQSQLGHADPSTTMKLYVHLIDSDQRKAVERVAEILSPNVAKCRQEIG